jgi:ligand-binding sensor domain-containing protein
MDLRLTAIPVYVGTGVVAPGLRLCEPVDRAGSPSVDQAAYHTVWTARDTLTGEVHALARTADGFLWAGTRDGLFRFDGVS